MVIYKKKKKKNTSSAECYYWLSNILYDESLGFNENGDFALQSLIITNPYTLSNFIDQFYQIKSKYIAYILFRVICFIIYHQRIKHWKTLVSKEKIFKFIYLCFS